MRKVWQSIQFFLFKLTFSCKNINWQIIFSNVERTLKIMWCSIQRSYTIVILCTYKHIQWIIVYYMYMYSGLNCSGWGIIQVGGRPLPPWKGLGGGLCPLISPCIRSCVYYILHIIHNMYIILIIFNMVWVIYWVAHQFLYWLNCRYSPHICRMVSIQYKNHGQNFNDISAWFGMVGL